MDVFSVTCNSNKRVTRKSINLSNTGRINHLNSCTLLVQMLLLTILVSTLTSFCYVVPAVDAFHHSSNSKNSLFSPFHSSSLSSSPFNSPHLLTSSSSFSSSSSSSAKSSSSEEDAAPAETSTETPAATSTTNNNKNNIHTFLQSKNTLHSNIASSSSLSSSSTSPATSRHKLRRHRSQVKPSKRSTEHWSSGKESEKTPRAFQSVLNSFKVSPNTIIRAKESREAGARFLNETQKANREECISWCWNYQIPDPSYPDSAKYPCNLAVYQETGHRSCYLFDCGLENDFKCKFTSQSSYTSLLMSTDHNSLDLTAWRDQSQQERDLMHLMRETERRSPPMAYDTATAASSSSSSSSALSPAASSSSSSPSSSSSSSSSTSNCKHYQFACKNSSECIAIYDVCNGIAQCPDGSDESPELDCGNRLGLLQSSQQQIQSSPSNSGGHSTSIQTGGGGGGGSNGRVNGPSLDSGEPLVLDTGKGSNVINTANGVNRDVSTVNGNNGYRISMGPNSVRGMVDQMSSSPFSFGVKSTGTGSVMEESGERIPLSGTSSPAGPPMILFHYPKSADIANSVADSASSAAGKSSSSFNPSSSSLPSMPYLRRYSSLIPTGPVGKSGQQQQQQQLTQLATGQSQQQQQQQQQRQSLDGKFYPSYFSPSAIGQLNGMDFSRASDITHVTNVAPGSPNYSPLGTGNAYITADSDFASSSAMQSGPFYWSILGSGSGSNSLVAPASMSDGNSVVPPGIPSLPKYSRVNGNNNNNNNGNNINSNNALQSQMDAQHGQLASSSISLDGWNKESLGDPLIVRDMSDHSFTSGSGKGGSIYNGNSNGNKQQQQQNNNNFAHHEGQLEAGHSSSVAKIRSPSFLHGMMLPPRISAVSHLRDSNSNGRDTNSAVIALTLGLLITVMLIAIVVLRMRTIKRRISRRGGRSSLTHDADYLINGMYL